MATLHINTTEQFSVDATVRESDKYSEDIFVKFTRGYSADDNTGCSEMFLTPNQLENLGRFFIRQADEIRTAQEVRHK
jgi:hypothetical protein